MRLKISYESLKGEILLPIHYNYLIHSLIYSSFSNKLATKLHNQGFILGKRKFKLFTFSRILEKGKLFQGDRLKEKANRIGLKNTNKEMLLFRRITFFFSSPFEDIIGDFGNKTLQEKEFNIIGQNLFVSNIEVLTQPRLENKLLIRMLSPVTIHSTSDKTGDEKAYYYHPYEKEFTNLIEKNAKKKFLLVYKREADGLNLKIRPFKFSDELNKKVIKFKGSPITGYTGIYELSGSRELIAVTYDAGLGDRNSEGFGMWEPWFPQERRRHGS